MSTDEKATEIVVGQPIPQPQPTTNPVKMKVLVADQIKARLEKFDIAGDKQAFTLFRVNDDQQLRRALMQEKWDLLFLGLFTIPYEQNEVWVNLLADRTRKEQLRGVIVLAPVSSEARLFVEKLRKAGVKAGWSWAPAHRGQSPTHTVMGV